MKAAILCSLVLALCGVVSAQPKIENTINKATQYAGTADKAGKAIGKVKGLFGKKDSDKKPVKDSVTAPKISDVGAGAGQTIITIAGIDYTKLKALNDNIRNCKGVQASKMAYDAAGSQIDITHTGSTETLMRTIAEISRDIFSDKNIASMKEGSVALKL